MAVGRFAPSPSGDLHLGNLRTALIAWLAARSTGSRFLMRIEDLEQSRVRPEFYDRQLNDLAAIGLDWDGPVIRQTDRLRFYDEHLARLACDDQIYPCYCTRRDIREATQAPHGQTGRYPGTCANLSGAQRAQREQSGRSPAVRIRADGVIRSFTDVVMGPVSEAVYDVVVRRNDGVPAYNLVVVLDDHAQGVEMVVRGDDLAATTPSQIFLAEALGQPVPTYAHVPLVLGPDGRRLAKRDGAVTLADRLDRGETAQEVASVLARTLGLAGSDELVWPSDVVGAFSLDTLPKEPVGLTADYLTDSTIDKGSA